MSRESSGSVFLRSLLMLACLVAIPVVALSGTSLPKTLKSILEGHWPNLVSSETRAASEPPLFEPVPPLSSNPAAPLEQRIPERQNEAPREMPWPAGMAGTSGSPVTPAAYQLSVEKSAAASAPGPIALPPPPRNLPAADPLAAPIGAIAGQNPSSMPLEPADGRSLGPLPTMGGSDIQALPPVSSLSAEDRAARIDQFSACQERLRQLGATYFLLESWGSQQQLYRFYCKMAIGGNPNCTRHFEATHADPVQAMAQVVEQIEAWRANRL